MLGAVAERAFREIKMEALALTVCMLRLDANV
jgi:hypothetical protein